VVAILEFIAQGAKMAELAPASFRHFSLPQLPKSPELPKIENPCLAVIIA
jgi:hypothetical protein